MLSQFSGAILNDERTHRFLLWRFWDERPKMLFIGLNPSTANELQDDPTVRRLCGFARDWGYGGLYVCNVFSQVTPDPRQLIGSHHPADWHTLQMAMELTTLSVCGWGDGIAKAAYGLSRANTVRSTLRQPMCFGLTSQGNPRHPLYLPKEAELEPFHELKQTMIAQMSHNVL
jgi:hypothetical protein